MSKVQVDKVVNLSDDGAPQLTYGAELPVGYGLTGAGGLNITGVVTAASAVFSGNVTIGGTLTYEDVTNIDVVGVSTFAGRMNVNSSALFNEGLSVTAGVTTIAGTTTHNEDVTFTGANYNAMWDKSKNALILNDNTQLNFGTDEDGDIYHDDGNMVVNNAKGKLMLRCSSINIAGTSNEKHIVSNTGVGVTLFYNNSARFETTNDGVKALNGSFYSAGTYAYIESSSDTYSSLTLRKTHSDADSIDYLQCRDNSNSVKLTISGDGTVKILDSITHEGDTNTKIRFPAADTISFETSGSERARIDVSGRLMTGTTAPAGNRSQYARIAAISNTSSSTGHGVLTVQAGANSSSGNEVAQICFSDPQGDYAWIQTFADATTGSTDKPGRLVFSTSADGSAVPTERLRITSGGAVQLNADSGSQYFSVGASQDFKWYHDGGGPTIFSDTNNQGLKLAIKDLNITEYSGTTSFGSFDTSGQIMWGWSGTPHGNSCLVDLRSNKQTILHILNSDSSNGYTNIILGNSYAASGTNATMISFRNGAGTEKGSIKVSADNNTQYLTSSDYRLKENASAITDGITRVKTLKPYRFNWKNVGVGTTVDGFFAHEVQSIVPEAIDGTKDQVATSFHVNAGIATALGDPIYQQMDQSKLVPLLTAALQESITKIETLETKVAALESS